MARPHVIANLDAKMRDDAATSPNQTTVTNTNDRRMQNLLPVNHSDRQRNVRPKHGVLSNCNVSFVHDGGGRPTNHTVVTKTMEPSTTARCGSNSSPSLQRLCGVGIRRTKQLTDHARQPIRLAPRGCQVLFAQGEPTVLAEYACVVYQQVIPIACNGRFYMTERRP